MVNWNCLPSSVQQCATFVFATNADRRCGQIDTMQTLAAKAACGCVHAYFNRLRSAIEDGELDPLTRDEVRELVDAFPEEKGDCRIGGLSTEWIGSEDTNGDDDGYAEAE